MILNKKEKIILLIFSIAVVIGLMFLVGFVPVLKDNSIVAARGKVASQVGPMIASDLMNNHPSYMNVEVECDFQEEKVQKTYEEFYNWSDDIVVKVYSTHSLSTDKKLAYDTLEKIRWEVQELYTTHRVEISPKYADFLKDKYRKYRDISVHGSDDVDLYIYAADGIYYLPKRDYGYYKDNVYIDPYLEYHTAPTKSSGSKDKTETTPSTTTKNGSYKRYHDSYDDGYDDVYFDGDYDEKRYKNDYSYMTGVDDAMEDLDEDW